MSKRTSNTISDNEIADISLEEMVLEVIDILGVALHFAGAKDESIQKLTTLYSEQIDKYYEKLPEDAPYGQKEMIEIIKSLKKDYPEHFHQ